MSFRIVGLDHVVVRTRDLERMVAFYRDALGCVEERRLERLQLVQMRAGRSMIDLIGLNRMRTRRNRPILSLNR